MDFVHPISEVTLPGDAADDNESKLQIPVAEGRWKESDSGDPDNNTHRGTFSHSDRIPPIVTADDGCVVSSQRQLILMGIHIEDLVDYTAEPPVSAGFDNAGGVQDATNSEEEKPIDVNAIYQSKDF